MSVRLCKRIRLYSHSPRRRQFFAVHSLVLVQFSSARSRPRVSRSSCAGHARLSARWIVFRLIVVSFLLRMLAISFGRSPQFLDAHSSLQTRVACPARPRLRREVRLRVLTPASHFGRLPFTSDACCAPRASARLSGRSP